MQALASPSIPMIRVSRVIAACRTYERTEDRTVSAGGGARGRIVQSLPSEGRNRRSTILSKNGGRGLIPVVVQCEARYRETP